MVACLIKWLLLNTSVTRDRHAPELCERHSYVTRISYNETNMKDCHNREVLNHSHTDTDMPLDDDLLQLLDMLGESPIELLNLTI
jgi:hypothetical protein